jgi:hypothetical protein
MATLAFREGDLRRSSSVSSYSPQRASFHGETDHLLQPPRRRGTARELCQGPEFPGGIAQHFGRYNATENAPLAGSPERFQRSVNPPGVVSAVTSRNTTFSHGEDSCPDNQNLPREDTKWMWYLLAFFLLSIGLVMLAHQLGYLDTWPVRPIMSKPTESNVPSLRGAGKADNI